MAFRRSTIRAALAGSAAMMSLTVVIPPSHADNILTGGSGISGCGLYSLNLRADKDMAVQLVDLTEAMDNRTRQALADDYAPTDLSVTFTSSSPDLQIFDENYGTWCAVDFDNDPSGWNYWGLSICHTKVSGGARCALHHIYYDTGDTNGFTGTLRQALACHEVGHTVGLEHRPLGSAPSCMRETPSSSWIHLQSDHEVPLINGTY